MHLWWENWLKNILYFSHNIRSTQFLCRWSFGTPNTQTLNFDCKQIWIRIGRCFNKRHQVWWNIKHWVFIHHSSCSLQSKQKKTQSFKRTSVWFFLGWRITSSNTLWNRRELEKLVAVCLFEFPWPRSLDVGSQVQSNNFKNQRKSDL